MIEPHPRPSADRGQLQQFCRQQIANFKVPTVVRFVESLPKNRTGKVLERALRGDAGA